MITKKKKSNRIAIYTILMIIISVFVIYILDINKSNDENDIKSNYIIYSKSNKVPDNYYFSKCDEYNSNYDDLVMTVNKIKMPFIYERNVFDCSQSASYVEWFLRNNCFNAVINVNFSDEHAWVTVYNISEHYNGVVIESVNTPSIVLPVFYDKYTSEVELDVYGIRKMMSNYTYILQGLDNSNKYYIESRIVNNNDWNFTFLNLSHGNYTALLLNHENKTIKESKNNINITINEDGTDLHGNISFIDEFQWWNTPLTDKFEIQII